MANLKNIRVNTTDDDFIYMSMSLPISGQSIDINLNNHFKSPELKISYVTASNSLGDTTISLEEDGFYIKKRTKRGDFTESINISKEAVETGLTKIFNNIQQSPKIKIKHF